MQKAIVLVVAAASVVSLSACKKSSHSAAKSSSSTSTPVNSSSGTTGTTAASSNSTSQPANGAPKLLADVCSMLDPSTITSVMGVAAQPTQELSADEDRAGGCLYGKFPGGFQTTTFTGASFDRDKLGWKLGFPPVSGVGNAAYSRGAFPVGNMKNVVVYVDYGDFGMEFAGTSPNATVAQVVKVAQSLK